MAWEALMELPIIKKEAWRVMAEGPSVGCWSVIMGKSLFLETIFSSAIDQWFSMCSHKTVLIQKLD